MLPVVVRAVRDELYSQSFPLKGETDTLDPLGCVVELNRHQAWVDTYDSEFIIEREAAKKAQQEKEAARFPDKYPAGIESVSKRARFLARKEGRTAPNGVDIEAAMTSNSHYGLKT